MSDSGKKVTIEISVLMDGSDAIAAYSDRVLDETILFNIDHSTGDIKAKLPGNRGGRWINCGTVSEKMGKLLLGLKTIILCREDDSLGETRIAVGEVGLEHQNN